MLDHNALTSIVSFNLPFFPTTGTLYLTIPLPMLIINLQSSHFISDGDRRTRSLNLSRIRDWSLSRG